MKKVLGLALLCVFAGLSGCQTTESAKQLSRVAKDWCLTIRASQVVPVYPLTQDIQPGDVFLVQSAISDEVAVFEDKGFLPMDVQVARLGMPGAKAFYGQDVPPKFWEAYKDTNWTPAPMAAFPTYTFKVKRGGGLNVALPIEGVPVAFGLLAGDSATGSVSLADSTTYGIDFASAWESLEAWAADHPDKLALLGETPPEGQPPKVFLRVVTRVYSVGHVTVSLTNDESVGANIKAGAAPGTPVPDVTPGDAVANFKAMKDAIPVAAVPVGAGVPLPGASATFTSVTGRSVSMDQPFARPLVIGYLGFDVPVFEQGKLGNPVLTAQKLGVGRNDGTGGSTAPKTVFRDPVLNEVSALLTKAAERADAQNVFQIAADKVSTDCGKFYADKLKTMKPREAFAAAMLENDVTATRVVVLLRGAMKKD